MIARTVLTLVLAFGFLSSANAEEFEACALEKYNAYAAAQVKWHGENTETIKRMKPKLEDVAELYLQDQLVLVEKRRMAVEQMLALKPDQVRTSFPPNRWLQLSPEDESFLRKSSKRYAELSQKAAQAKRRAPHPDGDALRLAMRTEIMDSRDFKKSFSEFMETVKGIEDRVCEENPNNK